MSNQVQKQAAAPRREYISIYLNFFETFQRKTSDFKYEAIDAALCNSKVPSLLATASR